MATLNIPITFTQFSPYVRGTVTYEWTDTAAVSAVSGFNASADGISSVTTNLSSANVVVAFDSNVDATVNLTACTSGAQLTVPADYNKDILLRITSDLQVGQVHSATSTARRIVKHTFVGTSDSIFTSSPANPSFTDIEAISGTTKSLGTFSVNDVDAGSPTYSATLTYRKDLGTITYSDAGLVNSSSSSKDVISSTNVSALNTVLSNMQYVPDVNGNPVTNQNAIVGDTLTLSMESTADKKIVGGQNVNITTSVSDTIQLTNTASSLAFTEAEVTQNTRKAFGTNIGVSPVFNNPGLTVNCKITYDKTKTTIVYPDTSIVDSTQPTHDTLSSTNMATINTALQTMTVQPVEQTSGDDKQGNFTGQTLTIDLSTSPVVTIGSSTTTLSYTATTDSEMATPTAIAYTRMTPFNLQNYSIVDGGGGTGATEIYALVFDPSEDVGTIELAKNDHSTTENPTTLGSLTTLGLSASTFSIYQGTGAESEISSNAVVMQGSKADLNTVFGINSRGTQGTDTFIGQYGNLKMNPYQRQVATISGATQADPVVVTATGHPFVNGEFVSVRNVVGMTELNSQTPEATTAGGDGRMTGRSFYKVANKTTNTFELQSITGTDVDSTGFTAYGSSGTVEGIFNPGLKLCPKFKNQDQALTNGTYDMRLYRAPHGTSSSLDINSNFGTFTKIFEKTGTALTESGVGFGVRDGNTGSVGAEFRDGTSARSVSFSRSGSSNTITPVAEGSGLGINVMFTATSPDFFSLDMRDNKTYVGRLFLETDQMLEDVAENVGRGSSSFNFGGGNTWDSGDETSGGATSLFSTDGFNEVGRRGGTLNEVALFLTSTVHTLGGGRSGANTGPGVGSTWKYRFSLEITNGGIQTDLSKVTFFDVDVTVVT